MIAWHSHSLAQRRLGSGGGVILPGKNASSATGRLTKYLAIPARPEARGHRPAEFNDLTFVPRGDGHAMLVQNLQTTTNSKSNKSSKSGNGGPDAVSGPNAVSGRDAVTPDAVSEPRGSDAESANSASGVVMFWLVTEVHPRHRAHAAVARQLRQHLSRHLRGHLRKGGRRHI